MRIQLYRLLILISLVLLILPGCQKKESNRLLERSRSTPMPAAAPAAPAAEAPADAVAEPADKAADKPSQRKVIMTYDLTLEVKETVAVIRQIAALAEKSGGFIVSSQSHKESDGVVRGEISIRVPSGKVGTILEQLRKTGKVAAEQANAEDITEGYVDLEARMKNARTSEKRLQDMMKQAGKLSDVLLVEKELTRVRGEIEAFEARKRTWDLQLEMTLIKITLTDRAGALPTFQRFWHPLHGSLGEALEGFSSSLRAMIIFVGVVLPWITILLPVSIFIGKRIKRWRETRRQRKTAKAAEQ